MLGGLEDGRRLALAPGDTLGRVGGDATASQLLYADTAVVDPFLSRRALEWVGAGVVRPKKAARHFVDPSWRLVRGDVPVRAGELLEVSPATCLRGCRVRRHHLVADTVGAGRLGAVGPVPLARLTALPPKDMPIDWAADKDVRWGDRRRARYR